MNSQLVTGIEGVNIYAQQFLTYALLIHGDYDVLKYTSPACVTIVGHYQEVDNPKLLGSAKTAWLTGQPLLIYNDLSKIPLEIADKVRAIIRLKRELDPTLYSLRYRHTENLRKDAGLLAAAFSGADNDRIVIAVHDGPEAKTFSIGEGRVKVGRSWNSEKIQLTRSNNFTTQPLSIAAVEVFLK